MMFMKLMVVTLLVSVVCLSGCVKSQSTGIATSEVYGIFSVEGKTIAGAPGVECVAEFHVSGATGNYMELAGNDAAFCSDGTREIELKKDETLFNIVTYHGSVGLINDVSRTYRIILRRGSSESHVAMGTLPAAMSVLYPTTGAMQTKGKPFPISWIPALSEGVDVVLNWTTPNSSHVSASDTTTDKGILTLEAEKTDTRASDGSRITGNIPAEVRVTRKVKGIFPATIKGTMTMRQSAMVPVFLVD